MNKQKPQILVAKFATEADSGASSNELGEELGHLQDTKIQAFAAVNPLTHLNFNVYTTHLVSKPICEVRIRHPWNTQNTFIFDLWIARLKKFDAYIIAE